MFMRYRGGGVGHKTIQKQIQKFCDDRWPEELKDIRELFTTGGSPEQPADDDGEEDATAPDGSSLGLIDPNREDDELPEGESESESESDVSEDEGGEPGNEAGGVGSDDDLEYADY